MLNPSWGRLSKRGAGLPLPTPPTPPTGQGESVTIRSVGLECLRGKKEGTLGLPWGESGAPSTPRGCRWDGALPKGGSFKEETRAAQRAPWGTTRGTDPISP